MLLLLILIALLFGRAAVINLIGLGLFVIVFAISTMLLLAALFWSQILIFMR